MTASHQGRGYGSALVRDGLARAHASATAGFLLTETERNASLYERLGFRIVEEADAPGVVHTCGSCAPIPTVSNLEDMQQQGLEPTDPTDDARSTRPRLESTPYRTTRG